MVQEFVLRFFRESTIGGYLTLSDNTFTTCYKHEESGMLVKAPGIISANITGNTFRDNPVKLVTLRGRKENHHYNNTVIKSGQIKVEE